MIDDDDFPELMGEAVVAGLLVIGLLLLVLAFAVLSIATDPTLHEPLPEQVAPSDAYAPGSSLPMVEVP